MSDSNYENCITKEFTCKRCKGNEMYPNAQNEKIMGYKCKICGAINYPVRDSLNKMCVK